MSGSRQIHYLTHRQIDLRKWDHCIGTAKNGLIYGYSFYLDHMARQWDALVLNDYEAVMPLTWNRKFGITYLYQPFLAAQLGIFGQPISRDLVNDFISAIPTSFRFIEISLNTGNEMGQPARFFTPRSNYVLVLDKPYEELYSHYRENHQRNIKKAVQSGGAVSKEITAEDVIQLALWQMKSRDEESAENVNRFRKLYGFLRERNMARTYGIVSATGELQASAVFFYSHKRAYYILVGNHPDAKTTGASHALIDAFIKDHAGTGMMLDFEGSDIRNLAFFYSGFGATHETYLALRINRLPFYLKWLKG